MRAKTVHTLGDVIPGLMLKTCPYSPPFEVAAVVDVGHDHAMRVEFTNGGVVSVNRYDHLITYAADPFMTWIATEAGMSGS